MGEGGLPRLCPPFGVSERSKNGPLLTNCQHSENVFTSSAHFLSSCAGGEHNLLLWHERHNSTTHSGLVRRAGVGAGVLRLGLGLVDT